MTEHTSSQKVDHSCREQMLAMGLPAESVDTSLSSERHDHVYTTYLLLLRKKPRLEALANGHVQTGPLLPHGVQATGAGAAEAAMQPPPPSPALVHTSPINQSAQAAKGSAQPSVPLM